VRCRASAELQLTANAGRCEWYSRERMRTAALSDPKLANQAGDSKITTKAELAKKRTAS